MTEQKNRNETNLIAIRLGKICNCRFYWGYLLCDKPLNKIIYAAMFVSSLDAKMSEEKTINKFNDIHGKSVQMFHCFPRLFAVTIWLPQFWSARTVPTDYWWKRQPTMTIQWCHCRRRKWMSCTCSVATQFCWRANVARKPFASFCQMTHAPMRRSAWTVLFVIICVFASLTLCPFSLAQMLNMAAVFTFYQSMIPLKV